MLARVFLAKEFPMKFIEKIFRSFPYTFAETDASKGIGSGNVAFGRPYMPLDSGMYGPRYNVQRALNTRATAGLVTAQSLPETDLKGNGAYFSGSPFMAPLNTPPDAGNV